MLQNARVTAFTISELLRENQQGEITNKTPSTKIKAKVFTQMPGIIPSSFSWYLFKNRRWSFFLHVARLSY